MEWSIIALLVWVMICDCDPLVFVVGVCLMWAFVWNDDDDDDDAGNAPVTVVHPIIVAGDETNTRNREDYCPEVPEDYSVKWIEYNGEITCTMGDKL